MTVSDEEQLINGQRYTAEVPDTHDLADRATACLHGLAGIIDPGLEFLHHFTTTYSKTPYMCHNMADFTCDPKLAQLFPLFRIITGSEQFADIQAAQQAAQVARIEDGLYWNRYRSDRPWTTSYIPDFDGDRRQEDTAHPSAAALMLRVMMLWNMTSHNERWDSLGRELCDGLARIAIDRGDYAYYPDAGFGEPFSRPRSGWTHDREPASETEGAEGSVVCFHGHPIHALSRFYRLTGYEPALDLAGKIARFVIKPKFWGGVPDPLGDRTGRPGHVVSRKPSPAGICGAEQGHWYTHFHARAMALRGILEYARTVGHQRMLEFVRRSYEYTRCFGIPRIGWTNTFPGTIFLERMEGCALGDMIGLAIRLSDEGLGDYWDDVDAIVRNQLAEQQIMDTDRIRSIVAASEDDVPADFPPGQITAGQDVIDRTRGIFLSMSLPGGCTSEHLKGIMSCCTGNAGYGIYSAWEGILRETHGRADVNLLLNRAGRTLDIDSYLPYEGKVVLRNKSARRIAVRMPCWVDRKNVRADISGKTRENDYMGNRLIFDNLKGNERITLTFSVPESTASYTIAAGVPDAERVYACTFRGGTAVDVTPREDSPTSYPFYLRDHMKKAVAPMKKTERFVADKIVDLW